MEDINFEKLFKDISEESALSDVYESLNNIAKINPQIACVVWCGRLVGRMEIIRMLAKIVEHETEDIQSLKKQIEDESKGK